MIGEAVSANYFRALKVASSRRRLFEPQDDVLSGGSRVAVLSHAFWAGRFRSDSSIVGKTVYYDEAPYVVVGVAEPGFAGVQPGAPVDMWVPVAAALPTNQLRGKTGGYLSVFARLSANAAVGAAQDAWGARFRAYLSRDVLPRYPARDRRPLESQRIALRPARSGLAGVLQQYQKPVSLLMGIAAIVLLISSANIANLVQARNAARRREIGVRIALGAGRGRVISQLLIESLLIAFFGAAAGIALASAAAKALIAMLPRSGAPFALDSRPDATVLGVTMAVAGITAVLFGLLPALRASRTDPDTNLRTGSRATGKSIMGRTLVAGQLALSLILRSRLACSSGPCATSRRPIWAFARKELRPSM